jgi:2-polyprenyl-3-methyl-5-hydroxy-6-metoxy-1,4-benzoquinol methylase
MPGLFRTTFAEPRVNMLDMDTYHKHEWEDGDSLNRIQEPSWNTRYDHEAQIISQTINDSDIDVKNILEIGSGPGVLSQKIQEIHLDLNYHLIDKPFAKKYFLENNLKGTFFSKDLSESFDTDGLLEKYDMVIMNDFLEHITNPHIILKTIYGLTHKDSVVIISNPNWRMGHPFVYRGFFDFDNLIYGMYFHLFRFIGLYGSSLQTPFYPKISSESLLPDEHITDWNHYMIFKHREDLHGSK